MADGRDAGAGADGSAGPSQGTRSKRRATQDPVSPKDTKAAKKVNGLVKQRHYGSTAETVPPSALIPPSLPPSPNKGGVSPHSSRAILKLLSPVLSLCHKQSTQPEPPKHTNLEVSLFVRWYSPMGKTKVNRLLLKPINNAEALEGISKDLIQRAFPEDNRPDYITSHDFYKFTPTDEFMSLPGDIARTEFRLVATYDGYEYTVLERELGAHRDPERKMLVTVRVKPLKWPSVGIEGGGGGGSPLSLLFLVSFYSATSCAPPSLPLLHTSLLFHPFCLPFPPRFSLATSPSGSALPHIRWGAEAHGPMRTLLLHHLYPPPLVS